MHAHSSSIRPHVASHPSPASAPLCVARVYARTAQAAGWAFSWLAPVSAVPRLQHRFFRLFAWTIPSAAPTDSPQARRLRPDPGRRRIVALILLTFGPFQYRPPRNPACTPAEPRVEDRMQPLAMLYELFDYHYWARPQLQPAPRSILSNSCVLSARVSLVARYSRASVAVEWIWLQRWRGGTHAR